MTDYQRREGIAGSSARTADKDAGESIVRKGGIGSDADADDVSRDTYGFTGSGSTGNDMSAGEARETLDEILPVEKEQDEKEV